MYQIGVQILSYMAATSLTALTVLMLWGALYEAWREERDWQDVLGLLLIFIPLAYMALAAWHLAGVI